METYTNTNGVTCVIWTDEQGMHSMTKEAYDEKLKQAKAAKINEPTPES
jgi:hypothetical protein